MQGYGFSSSRAWMWELDCEESWAPKNWCFWTVVLEKTLESPTDCKEIQPVHSKGDQSWVFIGRTDAKAETPILWPPHAKSWLIGKDQCWEGLGAGGEGDDRGWDGWMASLPWWTWLLVNSGCWWWTARPGVLRFMGLQRVGHGWATELNWRRVPDDDWQVGVVMRPCKVCKKLGDYPVSERLKIGQRHEQILPDFRSGALKSITRNVQTHSGGN